MSATALLLLLASGPQTLLDEVFQIPAAEWRYVPVVLKQPPVTVECAFRITSGSGTVRVTLVNKDGLDELQRGNREPLDPSAFRHEGDFSRRVSVPDEYAVAIENAGQGPASVRLRVSLDFSERGPEARYLSPRRRFVVIAISATVFLAIVTYSTRRLLGAMR